MYSTCSLSPFTTLFRSLVARHGGMVDKVVGDAVHALFNAPDDLDRHVDKALACADEIRTLTEEMRRRPAFFEKEFGRTRIGRSEEHTSELQSRENLVCR